jgi:prepilin-type processing-associated H-X9-DG protein
MYTMDNFGWFPPNGAEPGQPASLAAAQAGSMPQWCPGRQDVTTGFLSPDGTPPASNFGDEWIQCGLLYQYVRNVAAYKCPADNATLSSFGQTLHHSRSVSMNVWLSPNTYFTGISPVPLSYYQESSLVNPGPADTWVFIDENPNSINDGCFICGSSGYASWVDCPASFHNGAGGLAFADGHALLRKWTDPVVLGAATKWTSYVAGTTGFPDLNYLESASTVLPR